MTATQVETRGELWTAKEAAAELGVTVSAIKAWQNRGHIEPAVPGSRPRPGQPQRLALYWSDDLYDCQHDREQAALATRITRV